MTSTAPSEGKSSGWPQLKLMLLLPLVVVVILLILLGVALRSGDPSSLPSALIGKPIPEFNLPPIAGFSSGGEGGLSSAKFHDGHASLLNFWSSWCAPCQAESGELIELTKKGIPIYGINYKDTPEAARRFLARFGDPFQAIGADEKGFTAIDFGVSGVPETFVIDAKGRIVYRYAGPLTPEIVAGKIMPALNRARSG